MNEHKKRHACYDKPRLCLIFGLLKYEATFEEYCDLNTSAILMWQGVLCIQIRDLFSREGTSEGNLASRLDQTF